jgi:hypothetical protein
MNTKTSMKTLLYRAAALLTMMMMLFAALPAIPVGAVSLDITSVASGTWEATAWPNTLRSGTISVPLGSTTVTGTGTAFLTELSVGNILRTTTDLQIGTVASITSDTELTLVNPAATARTDIPYHVQGVGPADNAIIADTHTVTIAANPVVQTGTVTVNAGGTLTVSDVGTVFSTLIVNGTVNATTGNDFGELTVNSGGVVNAGTNGAYTALSLTVNSGGTLNISRNFTVDSTALIAGTISFGSTSGTGRAMLFLGPVTLQSGATWSEPTTGNGSNNIYTFFSNFTNDAAVFTTSDTSLHNFAGTNKTISGSTNTSIARLAVNGTYTNHGIITVGIELSGVGMLTNGPDGTLNVNKEVSIDALANAGTMTKTGDGPISIALANFTNTGTLNLNGVGTIEGITNNAGGTVNLADSGLITAFDNATATSVLNISDLTPPNITTLTVTAPGNTVNYNGAGDQTVTSMTYYNLVFSGSGNKSISMATDSTLANGNLSIAPTGTAKAAITGLNLGVNSLTFGGFGKVNGTWGSSSSVATNQNDTFFAPTTGYLNVATDTRLSQTITFTSTAPSNATVGGATYTPTATATSGLTVDFTIDPTASSVCAINAGEVSFIATGTCVINADQAGNENYQAAPQVQQSFTVSNPPSVARVFIAGNEMQGSPFGLAPGESTRQSFAGINDGPVQIEGNVDIVAAERVIYKVQGVQTSFSEMMGLPNSQLDTTYWLPWYNNVDLDTQLRFANTTNSTATVHVFIGGAEVTPLSGITLLTGESTRVSYAGVNDGPVQIISDQNIVAAERVIYKVQGVQTSFSEMMALPESLLDNTYWLPWYNNVDLDTQLRIGNVSNATATVHVFIGGAEVTPVSGITLLTGESTRVSYTGVNDGPVQIVSDQNIVAAERVIYKVQGVQTSFSEMMGLPNNQLDTTYWLPWYNNVDLDTQLRIGNVSGSTATVHIFIGGTEVTPVSGITLLTGESTRVSYMSVNDGPVQIVSDQNIVAAERVIYKVNNIQTSFSELMALPASQLDSIYWFPWYNNVDLDTQLRFGMP